MYLPGTVGERIGDLRTGRGWSQRELAGRIDLAPSQLSRIESGETQSVNSDTLIKLARAFGVSTDYILGLTTLSKPKSRDISELGLSEGAVTALTKPNADVKTLNRLLEHERWPYLLYLVKTYWDDSLYAGIQARNAVIDMATATLGDYMAERPEHRAEAQGDARFLRSQKLGDHEAELAKLNGTFQSILRDIKQAVADSKTPEAPAKAQFMQTMRERIQTARAEGKSVTAEEVTAAMADMVRQTVPLDGKGLELFKKLAGRVLRGAGK